MKKSLKYPVPDSSTPLCELAFKYGTDKCARIKHAYTPYYYKIFKNRENSIKKLVELGIGLKRKHSKSPDNTIGAGLYMWRDFFPNAQIYGADNDFNTMFYDNRIKTIFCDQSKEVDLHRLVDVVGKDIDVIIDDASHIPELQVFSCLTLMPLLNNDVTYIIEDVRDVNIVNKLSEYNYQIIEPEPKKYADDMLIVVKHKNSI